MSSRVLRIRDPIHGYVAVTAIEQPLLDHPITQRLRWVAQSGLAQFVFPEVRTSRFTHSLGTMHLASRFLLGILRNAEPPVRARLEREFTAAVTAADPDVELSNATIGELQRQGLIAFTAVSPDAAAATVVVEQALRLAALFHDLGHLPFSHDFEYVVKSLVNEEAAASKLFERLGRGKPPHEQIGYAMVSLLQRSVYASLTATQFRDVVSPAFKLARQIMAADEPYGLGTEPASIRLLHSLEELNRRLPQQGDTVAEAAWQKLGQQIHADHGVILSRVRFTPVRLDESTGASLLSVGTTASAARPLSELSPLIATLSVAWASDIQVFAFTENNVDDPAAVAAKSP